MDDFTLAGHAGSLYARRWTPEQDPTYVALLCHGYGEHLGRYEHVAVRLTADGAVAYAQDHVGHGRSEGERVLITDFEKVVADFDSFTSARRTSTQGSPWSSSATRWAA